MANRNRRRKARNNRNRTNRTQKSGAKEKTGQGAKPVSVTAKTKKSGSSRIILWSGLAVLVIAVVAVGIIATSGGGGNSSSLTDEQAASQNETVEVSKAPVPPPSERDPAPDIEGPTIEGKNLKLASFKGKPTVVHVWASWCEICRGEAETISELMKENPDVNFVGLNVEDTPGDAESYIDEFKWDEKVPHFDDVDRAMAAEFGLTGQPNTVILDDKLRIVQIIPGAGGKEGIQSVINAVKKS